MSSKKIAILLLFVFTLAILVYQGKSESWSIHNVAPAPEGWAVFASVLPDDKTMRCANYSKSEWSVNLNNGKILILPNERTNPPELRFHGGLLKGEDNGEFGGGLWWISPDGQSTKLGNDNVQGIVQTSFGTLVLTGLSHLSINRGTVYRIDDGILPPKMISLVSLAGAPDAFVKDLSGNILIVSSNRIEKLESPGIIKKFVDVDYRSIGAHSIVIDSDGIIYVGHRHFVTRITPMKGKFREDWLIPDECQQFQIQKYDCVCSTLPDTK